MKIKKILDRNRRDFTAILVCEHCGAEEKLDTGYDDRNYHENVIPKFKCKSCGKAASNDYQPQATKYPDGMTI